MSHETNRELLCAFQFIDVNPKSKAECQKNNKLARAHAARVNRQRHSTNIAFRNSKCARKQESIVTNVSAAQFPTFPDGSCLSASSDSSDEGLQLRRRDPKDESINAKEAAIWLYPQARMLVPALPHPSSRTVNPVFLALPNTTLGEIPREATAKYVADYCERHARTSYLVLYLLSLVSSQGRISQLAHG